MPIGRDFHQKKTRRLGERTILAIWWLWEQMCLRSKVRESMGLYRASWASGPRSWRHLPHHRTALRNLRARPRHARMYLLHHGAWVSIRVLTRSQCMAGRQTGMVGNAWMGSERLRHHHRWATKSPITGLHSLKRRGGQREGSVGVKKNRERERQNEVLMIATEAWAGVGLEKARLTWRHNRAAFSVGAEAKA